MLLVHVLHLPLLKNTIWGYTYIGKSSISESRLHAVIRESELAIEGLFLLYQTYSFYCKNSLDMFLCHKYLQGN